ncbi:hypothetical protein BLNAU_6585 [Blattamonas nauphoetae]|uniref:Uncharacterized protein n=1 Tax=Blattamonas nauphoetae TaxID=2049346 RepID=A0ABQ9Y485_9EUKA|nr:hypothetical protein BLNAU_6585 [Blattamonas nauphoetae]
MSKSILGRLDLVGPKLWSGRGAADQSQWEAKSNLYSRPRPKQKNPDEEIDIDKLQKIAGRTIRLPRNTEDKSDVQKTRSHSASRPTSSRSPPPLTRSHSPPTSASPRGRHRKNLTQSVTDSMSNTASIKESYIHPSSVVGTSSFLAPERPDIASSDTPAPSAYTPKYSFRDPEQFNSHRSQHHISPAFSSPSRLTSTITHTLRPEQGLKAATLYNLPVTSREYTTRSRSLERNEPTNRATERTLQMETGSMTDRSQAPLRQSSVFKSTTVIHEPLKKNSDTRQFFFLSHDTNSEVSSTRPRTVSLPLPRAGRDNAPRGRGEITMTDKMYEVRHSAIRPHIPVLSSFGQESGRPDSDRVGCGADGNYDPKDGSLSKRRRQTNVLIGTGMGTPFASIRNQTNSTMHSTETERYMDYDQMLRQKGRRPHPGLSFGTPSNQDTYRRMLKKTSHPLDTVDDYGNPLPNEVYDTSLSQTKEHHYSQVPFGHGGAHIVSMPNEGLTSDLDYQPDVTAGFTKNVPVSRSLVRGWDNLNQSLTKPGSTLTQNMTLPESLTHSTLISPSKSNFALISSGRVQHVNTADFNQISREQADPNRYNDKPVDRQYNTKASERQTKPRMPVPAPFHGYTSRKKTPVSHTQNTQLMQDLIYDPRHTAIDKHVAECQFGYSNGLNHQMEEKQEAVRGFSQNPDDVGFYDVNLKWVKKRIPQQRIMPEKQYIVLD